MNTPKNIFDDPSLNPAFKEDLKKQFITTAQSPRKKLFPAALSLALFAILILPLLLNTLASDHRDHANLNQLEKTLSRLESQFQADSALADTLEVDQRLTAYINQLNHIVDLLEQLITKLETTGHDTSAVAIQLDQAKQKLSEAQNQTTQPKQARDSLGNAVGHLRTSVTRAKEAL